MSIGSPTTGGPVVFTNKARCRDCCRCVRCCPVKAIRMHEGQANVVAQRCIGCGTCVRECPQGAKCYRADLDRARLLFTPGVRVAASIAPSFAAVYRAALRKRLPSALRRLGFGYVGETAIGAYHVAVQSAAIAAARPHAPQILTACPAAVRFVERYRPQLVPSLVPLVSPMLAHAKHIRARFAEEDVRMVFIGPCVAKKAEAERLENDGLVDCVLTFGELDAWLAGEKIDLSACEESDFDEEPAGDARLFPLLGGSVRTAGWSGDMLDGNVVSASGYDELCAALDAIAAGHGPRVLEPLFCRQGCVNGPAMPVAPNAFHGRADVLSYAAGRESSRDAETEAEPGLATVFTCDADAASPPVTEEQIRQELQRSGKARPEDQLDCGACGYPTCRDKAVAVIRGMAEPEMCLPRMKRLAEQRVDRIIDTSPNGIVILDEHLRILHMNPAFRQFFLCSEAVYGQPISYLMDPEPFERLAFSQSAKAEMTVEHTKYGLMCYQILYPLQEEKQFVGIFVNITNSRDSQKKLDHIRTETIRQARELLDHQIRMAEQLAQFLGESTARGEDLVEKLMSMAAAEKTAPHDGRNDPGWRANAMEENNSRFLS